MQSVTLIIDKRHELPAKYRKLLESGANSVVIAKSLIAAMKTIQDKEPDLIIISDSAAVSLPEDCRKIRALTYNMRPIIVGLSKSSELDDKLQTLESGADDFISEPVNPEEFVMRMKAHLRREYESNLDYKRLLPNKNYSVRALKRIVSQNTDWACLLISIENFQSYKEAYTELASDKLLQTYTAIIRSGLSENDYLGGLSDNEFLVITDNLRAEKIANYLTFAFDSVVSKFYCTQDNKRGFVLMQGDDFAGRRSNFVHTTIGVVNNEFIHYGDAAQLMSALMRTRSLAENPVKSSYMIERPHISAQDSVIENKFNNKVLIIENDEALSVLLKTVLSLQGYEVLADSRKTPAVIIIDAGDIETLKGIELMGTVRSNFPDTKIIMTSILHDKELILSAGADLYMPKPYEPAHLVRWVEQFIKEAN
ncbi:MAG: diguanylate cyclase [Heliobacteriaceae bacterium]|jgi:DNA-binding response OmpR family regulator|nr:diguanylate cyclase [Heliobacteriaceae bacterium]